VIQIAQDLGHRVVEKPLIRTDLYLADEVFMVGTAAEVTPIREVDDQPIGPPGPVTQEIQQAYLDTVHGRSERWSQWLEFAPAPSPAVAADGVSTDATA
jgi:branched-chain amino acid aminotransferase